MGALDWTDGRAPNGFVDADVRRYLQDHRLPFRLAARRILRERVCGRWIALSNLQLNPTRGLHRYSLVRADGTAFKKTVD